jgi:hypothetical protein
MEILKTLVQLGGNLVDLGWGLYPYAVPICLMIAWIAWWLWCVNWWKAFPFLAEGAWVFLVLLVVVSALVWSRIAPSGCSCLGFVTLPNFWWQLGAVCLYVGIALFCGWLQIFFQWAPPVIELAPPASHDAGHDSHGHDSHASPAHDAHH